MKKEELLEEVGKLGYPLFSPEPKPDVNKILAEVVKSKELRFWEGVPVILANCIDEEQFSPKNILSRLKLSEKGLLSELSLISLALFEMYKYKPKAQRVLRREFARKGEDRRYLDAARESLSRGEGGLQVGNKTLSAARIKKIFEDYVARAVKEIPSYATTKKRLELREEFDLEFCLSQIFSLKQKELFLKRLSGEPLSKTEKEYYSRTVKKKVLALANPELHRLAQALIK